MSTPSLINIQRKKTLKATLQNIIDNGQGTPQLPLGTSFADTILNGNAAGQANRFWQSSLRILTTNETINVYNFSGLDIGAGAGNDGQGIALALTAIVDFLVVSDPTSVGNLIVGGLASANQWPNNLFANTDYLCPPIPPGGDFEFNAPNGQAVGSANNNQVKFTASGGNVIYSLYILGKQ